jgi:hypothetical protein
MKKFPSWSGLLYHSASVLVLSFRARRLEESNLLDLELRIINSFNTFRNVNTIQCLVNFALLNLAAGNEHPPLPGPDSPCTFQLLLPPGHGCREWRKGSR